MTDGLDRTMGGAACPLLGRVGRKGTMIGRYLAYKSIASRAEVVETLRQLRQGTRKAERPAPETPEQVDYVRQAIHRPRIGTSLGN
jgi:hypothetical protein